MLIEELYAIFEEYPYISTDSRNCAENALFFALSGHNFNGNRFAHAALEKGCRYAIVDDIQVAKDDRYIVVENVLNTLQSLANVHRRKLKTKIIGITGTNGKTTTKELISTVLLRKYNILFTEGNLNNHIGVPLTLLKLTTSHEMGVIEMGANHVGEIDFLCKIAEPDFGIITNIGKAHLEGFGSYDNIIQTKTELYRAIKEKDGIIFLNQSNTLLSDHAKGLKVVSYKSKSGALSIDKKSPTLSIKWTKNSSTVTFITKLTGTYNLENICAAVCIGEYFEVSQEAIISAISTYTPTNNRSQIVNTSSNTIILDAYNANPTSMKAAISDFCSSNSANKVVILGDMKELGTYSNLEHQLIVNQIKAHPIKTVVLIGEEFKKTKEHTSSFLWFNSVSELIDYLKDSPFTNSEILVKGSRGMALERIIPFL